MIPPPLPPPVSSPQASSGTPRAKQGMPTTAVVMLVIGVVLAVVIGLIFVGITVSQQVFSQSSEFTISDAAVAEAENVIVLQAHDAEGNILGSPAVNATHDLLTHRLDRAGISYERVAFNHERIFVIFDDSASPDSMQSAEDVLNREYALEVRRVMATTTITDATAVEGSPEISNGQWFVTVTLDAEGARAFEDLTTKLVGEQWPLNGVALVLDGEVLSAPQVMAVITDGAVQIAGDFDQSGAESLAKDLKLASQGLNFTVAGTRTVK